MLNSARNADRDVEFGRHDFASLTDLPIVRRIAGIDRGAGRTNRGAKLIGHWLYILGEVLAALHRPAAGNYDLG